MRIGYGLAGLDGPRPVEPDHVRWQAETDADHFRIKALTPLDHDTLVTPTLALMPDKAHLRYWRYP
jgi:hypothetical protein